MGRSTFEGPVIAGDNRFGPQRNVGYVQLIQDTYIDFLLPLPVRMATLALRGSMLLATASPMYRVNFLPHPPHILLPLQPLQRM
jgi:hypothetical protein